jgi:uncharacterized repeat protein (TIGR01451 family)
MKSRTKTRQKTIHPKSLIFISTFLAAAVFVALPVYSAKSGSAGDPEARSGAISVVASVQRVATRLNAVWVPAPNPFFTTELVETFGGDCTTPKTDFDLGDTICAKISGAPLNSRYLAIVNPGGYIVSRVVVTSDPQTLSYTIPTDPTSTFDGVVVDNRGKWRANSIEFSDSTVRLASSLFVKDPTTPVANLSISKLALSGAAAAGGNISFTISLINNGPNPATDVQLSDDVPSHTTFDSALQTGGPTFSCTHPTAGTTGTSNCTISSLPVDSTASFIFTYQVDTGAASGTVISNTVNVTSATTDSQSSDNSETGTATVSGTAPGSDTCTVNCPDDIAQQANTDDGNGNAGAVVHFASPTGNPECGAITVDHCNDCFFPVGTTVVNATSATGDTCSFTVTVTTNASETPTISCPANITANADSNCSATVTLGNPTTTGNNVTVSVTRSDGLAMYDCDANGLNCVRKTTDLPFPAGTTSVTWTAYSHDTPGPYASPEDEEAHRTGNASCTQTVTVSDVTPPTITAPANTNGSANASCQAAIPDFSTIATVSDNCACASSDTSEQCQDREPIVVTQSPAAGTVVGLGAHTVTLTATDQANNTTSIDVTFTVVDTTAPTFTFVPPAVTAYTGSGATTCDTVVSDAVLGTATATDNCGPVTITRSPSGNTFGVGTTTVTWTAHDGAGNTATATQTVTVIDNTPPTISCPVSIVLEPTCPSGAVATYATPVGSDNCPGATTTRTAGLASGSVFPIGTTTVTHTVTDGAGNTASCSFTVTVLTTQAVIQNMINSINGLPLSGTQKQGLISKLQAASDAINDGKTNVACNKLSDFINQVTGYINNGSLTSAQGQPLINSANNIRNTIGCTNNGCS